MTTVIVGDRQTGKTYELVQWMIDGRPLPRWPMWSRVIVVADAPRERYVVDLIGELLPPRWDERLENEMREQLGPEPETVDPAYALSTQRTALGAMRRSVITASALSPRGLLRRLDPDIKVAIDDVDAVLHNALGLIHFPSMFTLTGDARTLIGSVGP